MLKIGICDDDITSLETTELMIKRLADEEKMIIEIHTFKSGEELINNIKSGMDILFLDIEMPGINGIEAAREIRKTDTKVTLVFMTNYAQYAIEGYSVKAYQYLLKPLHYPAFCEEIREMFRMLYYRNNPEISIRNDQGIFTIDVDKIQYIETTKNKNVIIHTTEREILCYQNMSAIENMLAPYKSFYRCHTSFLVNFNMVSEIAKTDVILKENIRIPVSKHRKKDMTEEYIRHLGKMI